MQAEIITIGDEILIGQITDTNSAWLGQTLGTHGISVSRITSVADNAMAIKEAVRSAFGRVNLILMTGGLGPTRDDITKKTLAELYGTTLVQNEEVYHFLHEMLTERGIAFNELNRSQSYIPEGCTMLPNRLGTAPGMLFERDGQLLISLPGVPFEMKGLVEREVIPLLRERYDLQANVHLTALTYGLPESVLAERIGAWESALPGNMKLAYLPNAGGVRLRLSGYETDRKDFEQEIRNRFKLLEKIIPEHLVGYGDTSLEEAVGELLSRKRLRLAVAESCTGGNVSRRITLKAGASDYFSGGVVAYSNTVKTSLLKVKEETLRLHGAVSRQVAEQMAEGVQQATGADLGISTTGVAGPGGGSPEKPVGTVWMSLITPDSIFTQKKQFGELRSENIERASSAVLNMLRLYLKGFDPVL